VGHTFRIWLQHESHYRLGNPIDNVRDAEDPRPALLGYLHRPDRTREIAAPPFPFTFTHASHTSCLGMSYALPSNFGSRTRFIPSG
jgi:hypothetical protein